ncbi:MAG: putative cytosolic protein [Gammaproteobacteria bacterium]|jgi:ketosteroid isomerase-like protein|nr:putative cytosolic protein [Gammaproteobacteria bacterium]
MTGKIARELVQQYIEGWKQNNIQLITSCLNQDCIVIESHGPRYHGVSDIERWFAFWLKANSRVVEWNILSFSFCEKDQTAFCEFNFACISNDQKYAFPGVSVVKFSDRKIAFIHEYRMTNPAFNWKGDALTSG